MEFVIGNLKKKKKYPNSCLNVVSANISSKKSQACFESFDCGQPVAHKK